jgi:hypothetical protein
MNLVHTGCLILLCLSTFYAVMQGSYGKPKALPCVLMDGQCLFLDWYEELKAEPVITGRDGH